MISRNFYTNKFWITPYIRLSRITPAGRQGPNKVYVAWLEDSHLPHSYSTWTHPWVRWRCPKQHFQNWIFYNKYVELRLFHIITLAEKHSFLEITLFGTPKLHTEHLVISQHQKNNIGWENNSSWSNLCELFGLNVCWHTWKKQYYLADLGQILWFPNPNSVFFCQKIV